ncbi:MAG TPA: AAA family ATPase [Nocardioides sp.]
MITNVAIRGWKAYEDLRLTLEPGTTFIVAHNGIGKTSLMQAVEWGLTGRLGNGSPDASFVRNGSAQASVEVVIDSGSGHSIHVTRTLRETYKSRVATELSIDGLSEPTDAALSLWLQSSFGFDQSTLSRLCFLAEGGVLASTQDSETSFNVVEFIAELFGAQALEEQAIALERHAARESRRGDSVRRQAQRGAEEDIRASLARITEIEAALKDLEPALAHAQSQIEQRRVYDRAVGERRRILAERSSLEREILTILGDLGFETASAADARSVLLLRDDAEVGLSEEVRKTDEERLSIEVQRAALVRSIELIDEHVDVCPTCRRPFAPSERDEIRAGLTAIESGLSSRSARATARQQLAERILDEHRAVSSRLRAIFERLGEVPDPGPEVGMEEPAVDLDTYRTLSDEASALDRERVEARRKIDHITALLGANTEAVSLYRDAYIAHVAARAFRAARQQIFSSRVDPLATEVAHRWKEIWPGEAMLELPPSGELQLLGPNGPISLHGFSGGERAVAVVLLRLLAAQMAGRNPFMWFDEPLEHLDSRNRRLLASVLAGSAASGAVRQIVVTTYEDAVTRRLGERFGPDDTGCRTVYVHSSART